MENQLLNNSFLKYCIYEKKLLIPILAFCYLLLTGCPLESNYPLKQQKDAIKPSKYIGTWKSDIYTSYEGINQFSISKGNETKQIVINILKTDNYYFNEQPTRYIGWIVTVEKQDFIIIESNTSLGRSYGHLGIAVKGKKLWLYEIDIKDELDLTSSESFLKYVTEHVSDKYFFDKNAYYEKL